MRRLMAIPLVLVLCLGCSWPTIRTREVQTDGSYTERRASFPSFAMNVTNGMSFTWEDDTLADGSTSFVDKAEWKGEGQVDQASVERMMQAFEMGLMILKMSEGGGLPLPLPKVQNDPPAPGLGAEWR